MIRQGQFKNQTLITIPCNFEVVVTAQDLELQKGVVDPKAVATERFNELRTELEGRGIYLEISGDISVGYNHLVEDNKLSVAAIRRALRNRRIQ